MRRIDKAVEMLQTNRLTHSDRWFSGVLRWYKMGTLTRMAT